MSNPAKVEFSLFKKAEVVSDPLSNNKAGFEALAEFFINVLINRSFALFITCRPDLD